MAKGFYGRARCQKRDKRRILHLVAAEEKAIVDSICNRITFSFSQCRSLPFIFRFFLFRYGIALSRHHTLFLLSPLSLFLPILHFREDATHVRDWWHHPASSRLKLDSWRVEFSSCSTLWVECISSKATPEGGIQGGSTKRARGEKKIPATTARLWCSSLSTRQPDDERGLSEADEWKKGGSRVRVERWHVPFIPEKRFARDARSKFGKRNARARAWKNRTNTTALLEGSAGGTERNRERSEAGGGWVARGTMGVVWWPARSVRPVVLWRLQSRRHSRSRCQAHDDFRRTQERSSTRGMRNSHPRRSFRLSANLREIIQRLEDNCRATRLNTEAEGCLRVTWSRVTFKMFLPPFFRSSFLEFANSQFAEALTRRLLTRRRVLREK